MKDTSNILGIWALAILVGWWADRRGMARRDSVLMLSIVAGFASLALAFGIAAHLSQQP